MKTFAKKIEQFINGELKGEALSNFQSELEKNPELKTEYELRVEIDNAIKEKDILDLKNQLSDIHKKHQKGQTKIIWLQKRTFYKIAAAIIVFAIVGSTIILNQLMQSDSPEMLYKQNYESYDGFTNRAADGEFDKIWIDAFMKYENKDFKGALIGFEKILSTNKMNITVNFYSGISNMELETFNKAVNHFGVIINHNDNLFIEQSNWYLGLCYLRLNKKAEAISIFKKISNSKSTYKEKAINILSKVKV